MTRLLLACATCALLALTGCKGETVVRDNPETLAALDACRRTADEKNQYIKDLERRLAELELKGGTGGEVVVTVTGDEVKITGKDTGKAGGNGAGDANDKEIFQAFLDQIQKARGSMKKCYQGALKNNSTLQAKTITMQLRVRFTAAGKVSQAQFEPNIGDTFDSCMRSIAERWTLPAAAEGYVFQQPITLAPQ